MMGKKAELLIKESLIELVELRKRQQTLTNQKRIIALQRIKKETDRTRQEVADFLCVNVRTLERWVNLYKEGGIEKLLEKKPRKKSSKIITAEIHQELSERLNDPHNAFLGYWEVQDWLAQHHDINVKYHTIRKYLITHFKTKVKRGRKSHVNKDPQAIEAFLKTTRETRTY